MENESEFDSMHDMPDISEMSEHEIDEMMDYFQREVGSWYSNPPKLHHNE